MRYAARYKVDREEVGRHIHLLVIVGERDVIPKSLQLVARKTAREFNRRKERKGAFWEDRYHATAIETGVYFLRCLVHIAVGSEGFVNGVLEKLERRLLGRKIRIGVDHYELREPVGAYSALFTPEKGLLRVENRFLWSK